MFDELLFVLFPSQMGDIPLCLIHIKLMMLAINAACNVLIGANDTPTPLGSTVKKIPFRLGGADRHAPFAVWPFGVTATATFKRRKPKLRIFIMKCTSRILCSFCAPNQIPRTVAQDHCRSLRCSVSLATGGQAA